LALKFLKSQPLNPSGFKIGLELLLKTPLAADQLVHVPYGFAKRQSGSSKLGVKVIIKYVGQLLALYHWKYGIFFYIFIGALVGSAVYALFAIAEWAVVQTGYTDTQVGRALVGERKKKRRVKSDV
jgi:dolichol-phosphate mannosyltransferase